LLSTAHIDQLLDERIRTNGRACAVRMEAAALRRDINKAHSPRSATTPLAERQQTQRTASSYVKRQRPDERPPCGVERRRLRLAGLIHRLAHTNHYTLTTDGIRIAAAYTKIYNRLLVPLTAADQPQAPRELRHALRTLDHHVDDYIARARLKPAA
jgi:hypothetical protein